MFHSGEKGAIAPIAFSLYLRLPREHKSPSHNMQGDALYIYAALIRD